MTLKPTPSSLAIIFESVVFPNPEVTVQQHAVSALHGDGLFLQKYGDSHDFILSAKILETKDGAHSNPVLYWSVVDYVY